MFVVSDSGVCRVVVSDSGVCRVCVCRLYADTSFLKHSFGTSFVNFDILVVCVGARGASGVVTWWWCTRVVGWVYPGNGYGTGPCGTV